MLVPLTAIVTTSLPMAAAIALCAKDRKTTHVKNKGKSAKSTRSSKSAHGKSSKSGKSSRSHRSKSQRSKRSSKSGKKGKSSKSGKGGKSGKSKKSGKSSKSKKQVKEGATTSASAASAGSAASEKSTKSSKSSRKSSKSSKSRKARRLDSDAQYKMEKSGKSSKNSAACAAAPKPSTGGKQMEKSLVEEVNAIKHSNQLSVFPAKLQYQTLGGVSQIELKNTSGERKAYKLKCSDNALYRVNPVFGFAEPHSTAKIDVLRLNGEQKTDKLVFLTTNAKDAADPHEAFAKQTEQREMMVVPLVAA
ncbi:hypothetical protein L3Y34_015556 [Caenorhabditis briggsae]|uniref:Major sperm protein n=1 Tax=Caenorhabditis briggsae TaxID=6238 RepID=A0AAE9DU22_CAEBR|nr:hypothetical protein L3Y34_015556 [Caenorhabditis briggsae]